MTEFKEALSAWDIHSANVTPITVGLINQTYKVEHEGCHYTLQRIADIFDPIVCKDIDALTSQLAKEGLQTPRLVSTVSGDAWTTLDGSHYRLLTHVAGRVMETATRPAATSAASLAAKFHLAMRDFSYDFAFARPGAHDLEKHVENLQHAAEYGQSRGADFQTRVSELASLTEQVICFSESAKAFPTDPKQIIHGDLKITNIIFDDSLTEALALIDWDTGAMGTLAVELGDALRSWSNPAGEDKTVAEFDLQLVKDVLRSYAELRPVEQLQDVPNGLHTICIELAARFCGDAYRENYFGWDPKRYSTRSHHNEARAKSQLSLAQAVATHLPELNDYVAELLK